VQNLNLIIFLLFFIVISAKVFVHYQLGGHFGCSDKFCCGYIRNAL